jgi:hypothetical protein
MTALIAQVVGGFFGFFGGLAAGMIGYAVDIATSATFQALATISPAFVLLGIVYAVVSFGTGVVDAYFAGVLFTLGIIIAGFFLGDLGTIFGGIISFVGLVLGFVKGGSGGNGI